MSGIPRILIVGAGLTGSAICSRLAGAPVSIVCWDKAGDIGGRMTTKCWRNQYVDIGPKFISRMTGQEDDDQFTELISSDVIEPMKHDIDQSHVANTNTSSATPSSKRERLSLEEDNLEPVGHYGSVWLEGDGHQKFLIKPDNYIAKNGSQSVVDYFFSRSNVIPERNTFLEQLNVVTSSPGNHAWIAVNSSRSMEEVFDAVILTIPVPQFIGMSSQVGRPLGDYLTLLNNNKEIYANLEKVTYFSSFSLGIFYERPPKQSDFLAKMQTKYFPTNEIIKYISVNSTPECADGSLAVCVHSHRTWADSQVDLSKDQARKIIFEEFTNLVGGETNLPEPSHVLCHKWRYSQTSNPYPGVPGAVCLVNSPVLIGAGDSFSVSNVGGCLRSAKCTVELLRQIYQF